MDSTLIAYYSAADTIMPTASQAISTLKKMNIKSIMITGDNPIVAQVVSKKLGIDTFIAQVLPADKAKEVEKLKKENVVGMVGDGVNDAPALAVADVGIAMGSGTDIALETAGMALLHSNLNLVPFAIRLSKATIRNINQNLVWAFGYNIVLIPVAMGLLNPSFGIMMHPMLAGGAMVLSSLSVVFNSLRLKRFKMKG